MPVKKSNYRNLIMNKKLFSILLALFTVAGQHLFAQVNEDQKPSLEQQDDSLLAAECTNDVISKF